ncbi:hypothetical protein Tco_0562775 [Tanacetum coccineum]
MCKTRVAIKPLVMTNLLIILRVRYNRTTVVSSIEVELNRHQEMLSLRNYNHDPPVDLYDPGGRNNDIEVTLNKERFLSDHCIAHVTPPAYGPPPPFLATIEPLDTLLMGDEVSSTTLVRENDKFIKSSVDDLS